MSRNVYRLCNTSHIHSKPANAKIIQTIAYWIGQIFAKPRLTMVCITPAHPQQHQPSTGNKAALANHTSHSVQSTIANQKTQGTRIENTEEKAQAQAQDATDKGPNFSTSNTTKQSISSPDSPLTKAGKKANMLFLKVYNGPIFQDKKVDPIVKTQGQPRTQTSQSALSIQDPFCLPNHGLYPACLPMLNTPKQGKNPVFISGKMSDIFAQLDQLAA